MRALGLGLLLIACGSPLGVDGASDAAIVRDAWSPPPDAWAAVDGGPPVIAQQSWTVTLALAPAATMSITLEARAEAGTVRAVLGGGGISAPVVMDVAGGTLVARDSIEIGIDARTLCDRTAYVISGLTLGFDDADGDGTHETLVSVRAADVRADLGLGVEPFGAPHDDELAAHVERDGTPPRLTLLPDVVSPGMRLVLRASEPMTPLLVPQLVGDETVPLLSTSTASAAAEWTLDTWDLPAGHYALRMDGPTVDLVGLAATPPTVAFDLPPVVALDAMAPSIHVRSAVALRRLGDDETPSAAMVPTFLAAAPVVMVIDVVERAPGRVTVSFQLESHGSAVGLALSGIALLPDGTTWYVQWGFDPSVGDAPSGVVGYANETPMGEIDVLLGHPQYGRLYLALVPTIPDAAGTCASPSTEDIGIVFQRPLLL